MITKEQSGNIFHLPWAKLKESNCLLQPSEGRLTKHPILFTWADLVFRAIRPFMLVQRVHSYQMLTATDISGWKLCRPANSPPQPHLGDKVRVVWGWGEVYLFLIMTLPMDLIIKSIQLTIWNKFPWHSWMDLGRPMDNQRVYWKVS